MFDQVARNFFFEYVELSSMAREQKPSENKSSEFLKFVASKRSSTP